MGFDPGIINLVLNGTKTIAFLIQQIDREVKKAERVRIYEKVISRKFNREIGSIAVGGSSPSRYGGGYANERRTFGELEELADILIKEIIRANGIHDIDEEVFGFLYITIIIIKFRSNIFDGQAERKYRKLRMSSIFKNELHILAIGNKNEIVLEVVKERLKEDW